MGFTAEGHVTDVLHHWSGALHTVFSWAMKGPKVGTGVQALRTPLQGKLEPVLCVGDWGWGRAVWPSMGPESHRQIWRFQRNAKWQSDFLCNSILMWGAHEVGLWKDLVRAT